MEEEGIEPVWHRSSTGYRAYKTPPRPALPSIEFGASPENRTQPHRLMRAGVPLVRGMAREAGLEPAGSVLETDSVAASLTPSNFHLSKSNKNPRTGRGSVSAARDTDPLRRNPSHPPFADFSDDVFGYLSHDSFTP